MAEDAISVGSAGHDARIRAKLLMPAAGLAFGAIVTSVAAVQWARYIDDIRPIAAVIREFTVHPRDEHGSVMLEVRFQSAKLKSCVRFGTHMLSRIPGDTGNPVPEADMIEQEFDFLPGSIAGAGYTVRAQRSFVIKFHLPSSIEPGPYTYSYRTFYQCDPWRLVPFQDEVTRELVIP